MTSSKHSSSGPVAVCALSMLAVPSAAAVVANIVALGSALLDPRVRAH